MNYFYIDNILPWIPLVFSLIVVEWSKVLKDNIVQSILNKNSVTFDIVRDMWHNAHCLSDLTCQILVNAIHISFSLLCPQ